MGSKTTHFFMKGEIVLTNHFILEDTRYGHINCYLKEIMSIKKISIYQLARLSDTKYEIIERYYDNKVFRYDANVLCRLCYALDCNLTDIIRYDRSN